MMMFYQALSKYFYYEPLLDVADWQVVWLRINNFGVECIWCFKTLNLFFDNKKFKQKLASLSMAIWLLSGKYW